MRERFADIPWQDIVGMRNRLIHGYFDVDIDRVWDTVNSDLPELLKLLEAVVDDNGNMGSEVILQFTWLWRGTQ